MESRRRSLARMRAKRDVRRDPPAGGAPELAYDPADGGSESDSDSNSDNWGLNAVPEKLVASPSPSPPPPPPRYERATPAGSRRVTYQHQTQHQNSRPNPRERSATTDTSMSASTLVDHRSTRERERERENPRRAPAPRRLHVANPDTGRFGDDEADRDLEHERALERERERVLARERRQRRDPKYAHAYATHPPGGRVRYAEGRARRNDGYGTDNVELMSYSYRQA